MEAHRGKQSEGQHWKDRCHLSGSLEELEEAEEPTDADEDSTNEIEQSMLTFEKIKDDPMLEEAAVC